MPGCVVAWCRSHTRLKCPKITFHSFPTDIIRQNKWIAAVRLERQDNHWMPSKTSRVCSIHFEEKEFYKSSKGNSMLQKTAVPVCTMVNAREKCLNQTLNNLLVSQQHQQEMVEITTPINVMQQNLNQQTFINQSQQLETIQVLILDDNNFNETQNEINTATLQNDIKQEPMQIPNIVSEQCSTSNQESNSLVLDGNRQMHFRGTSEYDQMATCPRCDFKFNYQSPDFRASKYLQLVLEKKTLISERRLTKIRTLEKRNRRLTKRNALLKDVIKELKNNGLLPTTLKNAFADVSKKKEASKGNG